jgi:cytochrome c553
MMNRSLRKAFPLTAALLLATGIAAAGGPSTPLGAWMKPNMGVAFANGDFPTLQKNFGIVGSKPPPSGDYPQWATFAKAGADAAGKSDAVAAKAACTSCHTAYREKYKKDFPTRAFP